MAPTGRDVTLSYEEDDDGVRWRLAVDGHGTVAESATAFPHEYAAEEPLEDLRAAAADAEVRTFEERTYVVHRYETEKTSILPFVGPKTVVREGEQRLVDADGTVVTTGGDSYETATAAEAALERTMEVADDAVLREVEGPAFELFAADDGHGWRLVDRTGETLVTGEGRHDDERTVRDLVDAISRWASG